MSKRKHDKTIEQQFKLIKAGFGQGVGIDYKPWLTIQDVPSRGRRTRCMGIKIKREHHFLSDLERDYFYIIEFEDSVIDIREQFPLLPLQQTIAIADELGIEHPKDPKTKEPIVMTTDFVITLVRNGKPVDIARTIKYKKDLLDERTLEKFEIERRYWEMQGIRWGIVTDQEIDKKLALNISSLRPYYDLSDNENFIDINEKYQVQLINEFKHTIIGDKIVIREKAFDFDEKMCLPTTTGLAIFQHLLITKQIDMDLTKQKLTFERPVQIKLYKDISKGEYAV